MQNLGVIYLFWRRKRHSKTKCSISITERVLGFIEGQACLATKEETGGIIGGLGSVEEGSVVVSHASDGGPSAKRKRYFFSRDTVYCQKVVDVWASQSDGKVDYLGEWHKHFEDDPKPSITDLQTLKTIADKPDYHITTALLLIIGNSNKRSSLRVFMIDNKGKCTRLNWF